MQASCRRRFVGVLSKLTQNLDLALTSRGQCCAFRELARSEVSGCCGGHPGGLESLWVGKGRTQLRAAELLAAFDVPGERHQKGSVLCTVAVVFRPSLLFCRL